MGARWAGGDNSAPYGINTKCTGLFHQVLPFGTQKRLVEMDPTRSLAHVIYWPGR
jgi:hypothetical protein